MTGQLVSRLGTYDNASDFAASVPTFAHYLRQAGYRTCLAVKFDSAVFVCVVCPRGVVPV